MLNISPTLCISRCAKILMFLKYSEVDIQGFQTFREQENLFFLHISILYMCYYINNKRACLIQFLFFLIYISKLPVHIYAGSWKLGINPYQVFQNYIAAISKHTLTRCWVGFWERELCLSFPLFLSGSVKKNTEVVMLGRWLDCNFPILILFSKFQKLELFCWLF